MKGTFGVKKTFTLIIIIISFSIGVGVCHISRNISERQNNSVETTDEKIVQAIAIYQEFLEGKISSKEGYSIEEMTIPTGEPEHRFSTSYAFWDSTGDDIPELHVNAARYYYVFAYRDGELVRWLDLSPYPCYEALKSGAFIFHWDKPGDKGFRYSIFDYSGNEIMGITFNKYDKNNNYIFDEDDEYLINWVEVTQEAWEGLASQYLYIDENGVERIRDEIDWTVLYE